MFLEEIKRRNSGKAQDQVLNMTDRGMGRTQVPVLKYSS